MYVCCSPTKLVKSFCGRPVEEKNKLGSKHIARDQYRLNVSVYTNLRIGVYYVVLRAKTELSDVMF